MRLGIFALSLLMMTLLVGCGRENDNVTCVKMSESGYCLRYEVVCSAWNRKGSGGSFECERLKNDQRQ